MKKTKAVDKQKELLELGTKLQQFYDSGYVSKKQSLIFSFLKGLVGGFGAFLGGTILIALLLWILSLFKSVPLLNHVIQSIQMTLHRTK